MCYLTKILDDTPNHSRPGNMDLQGNYKGLGMTRKTHHKFARKLQSTMINIYTQFSQIPHNFVREYLSPQIFVGFARKILFLAILLHIFHNFSSRIFICNFRKK